MACDREFVEYRSAESIGVSSSIYNNEFHVSAYVSIRLHFLLESARGTIYVYVQFVDAQFADVTESMV